MFSPVRIYVLSLAAQAREDADIARQPSGLSKKKFSIHALIQRDRCLALRTHEHLHADQDADAARETL
jgi:hypothetical protein